MILASATVGEKHLTGTSETFTSGSLVAIGEILTYQATLEVPSGVTLSALTARDQLDPGLGFVDCVSISAPAGLTGGFDAACNPDKNPTVTLQIGAYNDASLVIFSLGDVTNSTAATQTLTIIYRVVVLDVPSNVNGISGLNNRITWAWGGGDRLYEAEPVEIIEPDLDIDKSASPRNANYGRPIHFTVDIEHTAQSRTDAFDVVMTDVVPAGLTLDPATIEVTGTASTLGNYVVTVSGNTLTVTWAVFRLGQNARVTFDAAFIGPAPVINSASVAWTSLPIDPQPGGLPEPLSPYNDYAHERWYDPASLVDIYRRADDATINLPAMLEPEDLPETGFAPNVVTQLPAMPKDFAYAQTDLSLEIPKLKQTLAIAGVPYDNAKGEWNLTWLNAEAGWLENTAFPTHSGNSALTAHVTLPNGQPGPFVKLDSLRYGDQIIVHLGGQKYIFEVRESKQVKPNAVNAALKHEEYPWLTLITCKTYNEKTGEYAYRTVVRAVLVKVE